MYLTLAGCVLTADHDDLCGMRSAQGAMKANRLLTSVCASGSATMKSLAMRPRPPASMRTEEDHLRVASSSGQAAARLGIRFSLAALRDRPGRKNSRYATPVFPGKDKSTSPAIQLLTNWRCATSNPSRTANSADSSTSGFSTKRCKSKDATRFGPCLPGCSVQILSSRLHRGSRPQLRGRASKQPE